MPLSLTIPAPGEAPVFALTDQAEETLTQRQVRVDWHWAGLNRADLLYPRNKYFSKPAPGSRMGFEAAGIVREAGELSRFKPGDRVAALPLSIDLTTQGCLSESGVYDDTQLVACIESLDLAENAAFWMAYLTAYGGLVECGQLQAEQTVIITAASSAVGLASLRIAKALGAHTIATSSSTDKTPALQAAGADHVLPQPREAADFASFVAATKTLTRNEGCALIFDAVAGPASRAMIQASRRGGRFVIHGLLDRRPMDIHAGVLMKRLLTLQGYTLDQTLQDAQARDRAVTHLTTLARDRNFTPHIDRRFTLQQFQAAFDHLASNRQVGKVLVACQTDKL